MKHAKANISLDAEHALDRMLSKANDGFDGGRVTKQQLTSWIIFRFEELQFANSLEQLRNNHFDQVAYLETVVRQIKQSRKAGEPMDNFNALLAPLVSKKVRSAKKKEETDASSEVRNRDDHSIPGQVGNHSVGDQSKGRD